MQDIRNYETVPISYKESFVVNYLYNGFIGGVLLRLLVKPCVSKFVGLIMDSPITKIFIPGFIKRNNIKTEEYRVVKYKSFNDFFKREIKKELRPFSMDTPYDLAAPCDGKLTAYPITPDGVFHIKNSMYTIDGLLQDKTLSREFMDGLCLVFRLMPDDYHRYAYIDDGEVIDRKSIKGLLHTVRPIAHRRYKIFAQNAREYEVLRTEHFGKVVQIEVGALFVGRITNYKTGRTFKRGEEKGVFEYGGSTIVMLFQSNAVTLDSAISGNTLDGKETIVRMGYKIGEQTTKEKES